VTLDNVQEFWLKRKSLEKHADTVKILVANKSDIYTTNEITEEKYRKFMELNDTWNFFRISVKNDEGINQMLAAVVQNVTGICTNKILLNNLTVKIRLGHLSSISRVAK
jgi:tRNA U34 5-carboxymethylaminomethyl modifying GTPase MnmE/TrmE